MRVDAHQHFWQYDPRQYPWIQPDWLIRRDFLPGDLEPLLKTAQLDGSIAVQARQSLQETEWLLQLADEYSTILAVVGWVDLQAPPAVVEAQLQRLSQHPKFLGVRHVVQDEPDDRFLLSAAFTRGLDVLSGFDLVYDLLLFPKQLPAAIELVARYPKQRFVLDHIAKPQICDGKLSPWREQIQELATAPNLTCKVSGLVTEAKWAEWKREDFTVYLDTVVEAFGSGRLMFGSDWPVCLLAARYDQVYGLVQSYAQQFSPAERDRLFGQAAQEAYRIPMVAGPN